MRVWLSVLLLLAFGASASAQDPIQAPPAEQQPEDDEGDPKAEGTEGTEKEAGEDEKDPAGKDPEAEDDPAAEADDGDAGEEKPEEPPAWQMPERDARRFWRYFDEYLHPKRKTRRDVLEKFEKFVQKPIDGHSALEDVKGLVDMANRARRFDRYRRGRILEVEVKPDIHGFPGGIGTVWYHLYVPEDYSDRDELWPLLFCLPDTKAHANAEKYIQQTWVNKSKAIEEGFLVAVPRPESKGDAWTSDKSMARAMIALRHCMGTYDATRKNGGPATDMLRVFLVGGETAALVAARYPEVFRGAILTGADGKAPGGPDTRKIGRLSGVPAYFVWDGKNTHQKEFGQKLKRANAATVIVESKDDGFAGNADAIAKWVAKLEPRAGQPRELEYAVHDPSFQRHYWINVLEFDAAVEPAPSFTAEADRATNEVRVNIDGIVRFELFLNDALVDLNRKVRIVVVQGDEEYEFFADLATRSLGVMLEELVASNHPWRIYPVRFLVDLRVLRQRAAKKAAQEAKEAAAGNAGPSKASMAK